MTSTAAGHPEHCLHAVWEQLTAAGFTLSEPAASTMCLFTGLRGAHCEMDLMHTGAFVWVHMPLAGSSPQQAARQVLALLSTKPAHPTLPPAQPTGLALPDAAAQILAAAGMAAQPVTITYGPGDVCTELLVTSPAEPARGHARISGEGTIRWECTFATPTTSGLTPHHIAHAITTALHPAHQPPRARAGSMPANATSRRPHRYSW